MDMRLNVEGLEVRICERWDVVAIRPVLDMAFGQPEEGYLVEALARNGHLHLSLCAEIAGEPVGYIGFSPVTIDRGNRRFAAQGLAPLAVLPKFQNQGIGSTLVRIGLDATYQRGDRIVVVVGDPRFYRRFGFEPGRHHGIVWRPDPSGEHLQVIGRDADALEGVSGKVSYMPEFADV